MTFGTLSKSYKGFIFKLLFHFFELFGTLHFVEPSQVMKPHETNMSEACQKLL